jgi:small basic protein
VIAVIGLLVGVAIGVVWHPAVPLWLEPYLPIAIVAALDAVAGGIRALVEKRFDERIFVVSFLSNVLIASLLVFLGDRLGVGAQMSTGVVVVLAMRIFANAAAIRRTLFRA